jgi:hypothetical protein
MLKEYQKAAKKQGIFSFFLFFIFMTFSKLARRLRSILPKLLIYNGLRRAAGRAAVSR